MRPDLRWSVEPPWGVEPQTYALRVDSRYWWLPVDGGCCRIPRAHSVAAGGCYWWLLVDLVRTSRGPPRD